MVEIPGDAFKERPELDMLDEEGTYRCGFCSYTQTVIEGDPPCKKCLLPRLVKALESIDQRQGRRYEPQDWAPTPE